MHAMVQLQNPLAVKIRKQIVKAMSDFDMLKNNDKIMVCVSGGKDSSILLALLTDIQKRAPYAFTFEAVLLDQKQPGFNADQFSQWVGSLGVKLHVLQRDTYSIVKEKVVGKTFCSLCSRLRRGILYDYAVVNGFTKVALGHHRNDLMETLLLNLFYQGRLGTMPPKLLSDDKRNLLIRPMAYVDEADLISLAKTWDFPIIPCNLCGSQDGLKRKKVKNLLLDLEQTIPNIGESMLNAMKNVKRSQLLDSEIWNFEELITENELTYS